jgi:hypothetical protein
MVTYRNFSIHNFFLCSIIFDSKPASEARKQPLFFEYTPDIRISYFIVGLHTAALFQRSRQTLDGLLFRTHEILSPALCHEEKKCRNIINKVLKNSFFDQAAWHILNIYPFQVSMVGITKLVIKLYKAAGSRGLLWYRYEKNRARTDESEFLLTESYCS